MPVRSEDYLRYHPQVLCDSPWRHLVWSSPTRMNWLSSEPQASSCLGLPSMPPCLALLCGYRRGKWTSPTCKPRFISMDLNPVVTLRVVEEPKRKHTCTQFFLVLPALTIPVPGNSANLPSPTPPIKNKGQTGDVFDHSPTSCNESVLKLLPC